MKPRNPTTKKARSGAAEMAELVAGRGKGTVPALKRPPGRPPRLDEPQRIAVHIPGELKRRLRIYVATTNQDMGAVVAAALERFLPRE